MSEQNIEPMTVTIPTAVRISGLGRTKLYELIAEKQVESITVGTRRLIVLASLKRRLSANAK